MVFIPMWLSLKLVNSSANKYTFSIDNIKLKKVAYVRIIPELEDIRTQANFSFNIGIEKRAIELSPKQTEKRIENILKRIVKNRGSKKIPKNSWITSPKKKKNIKNSWKTIILFS